MRLTWCGTAGFRIETRGRVFLIDPYLSRITAACPALPVDPQDVTQADEIYLSHGHFDHAADVPPIVNQTGATVYCSAKVAQALRRRGVEGAHITTMAFSRHFRRGSTSHLSWQR